MKGNRYSIITDYLGAPVEMYNSWGLMVWRADYDIYGGMRAFENPNEPYDKLNEASCPFRYQGQYFDEETYLTYNRFRYYSYEMGGYISQDPIGLAGGNPTLYGYVQDSNCMVDMFGLTNGKYVPTQVLGRKVHQNPVDFDGGVPKYVDPIVGKTNPSVQKLLDAGASNYDLMSKGYAPIGSDGKQINLHHVLGSEPGPMVELLDSTHKKHYKPLHGLVEDGNSFRNNRRLNYQYEKFRKEYWKERAKSFKGSCH